MRPDDRWIVTDNMRDFILENDSTRWAETLLKRLQEPINLPGRLAR